MQATTTALHTVNEGAVAGALIVGMLMLALLVAMVCAMASGGRKVYYDY